MNTRAECHIPLRNFLGTSFGNEVAKGCGQMRIAWILGASVVLTVGLMISHFITKRQQEEYIADPTKNHTIVVPLWLCALPVIYSCYTWFTAISASRSYWEKETLHFDTSEMNKKDFLLYTAGDSRQHTQSAVAITNTALIGATSILGPFARGGM